MPNEKPTIIVRSQGKYTNKPARIKVKGGNRDINQAHEIDSLGLQAVTRNKLVREGAGTIHTLRVLTGLGLIRRFRTIGVGRENEIRQKLEEHQSTS